ncbi:MAG: radical SAM family heme chaperone HemW [Gammaproteobacteria bacterium]
MHPLPLALYVHVPWCVRKCPYCDFNSHEATTIPEAEYVQALLRDLQQDAARAQGRVIQSIFIGGGTPSLFSADSYAQLLQAIDRIVPIASDAEITLEANPGTFELQKFRGFRAAGINRLSVGVQSFNPQQLAALGRIHNRDEAIRAIGAAREVGFERLNIDLMHGLPQQSVSDALADLQQAVDLQPSHLSWYQLTIEPNTVFYSKPPRLPDDELLWDIDQAGKQFIAASGFNQYEISAYARPGFECAHNLNYWLFGDYLAIGAGAHGKITDLQTGTITRYNKTRLPKDYLAADKPFTAQQSIVATDDLPFEFFMNVFRLNQPIPKLLFEQRTGLALDVVREPIAAALHKGLITESPTHWQTTPLGQLFLNELLQLF